MSDDVVGDDEPVPLRDAAQLFFNGRLTKSALRTEARKGNLEIVRIANKDFVTRNAIRRMIESCTQKTAQQTPSNQRGMSAQEALRLKLQRRRGEG
ncbi:hypothetical protein [Rhizobium mongolense]|uniref:Uncharacterized protein n=2 Tax=Rhizobium mongolense TaxID=57676 RepID=A0ABR6IUD5_9HYPH|nr:hypothetical protein [Rhizobium mongolense]MBB4231522.1 hypothetical protein [Rhizobium mongolense]TVZ64108.1 hypothetical protein BCL32_4312 [Rhizobium mongolense USDA 1844]